MSDFIKDNMLYSKVNPQETEHQKRARLRTVLNDEISVGEWRNAWITLSWLTNDLRHLGKVRIKKTDAAVIIIEGDTPDTSEFPVNWKEVICV